MAGAIIEHPSDPVHAIGAWARLAREVVLIPVTDVIPVDDLMMRPITPLKDSNAYDVWRHLSRGLYVRLFDNLGLDMRFAEATALHNDDAAGARAVTRPSLVAARRG